MKFIDIGYGYFTRVSNKDYTALIKHAWHLDERNSKRYVRRREGPAHAQRKIYLHREIKQAKKGVEVDHIDGNGLNNVRSNLRMSTRTQNSANKSKQQNNTSGYKGVYWHKANNKWAAHIQVNKKSIHLGVFNTKKSAAVAYDKAAKKYFGKFAQLNF